MASTIFEEKASFCMDLLQVSLSLFSPNSPQNFQFSRIFQTIRTKKRDRLEASADFPQQKLSLDK